MSKKYQWTNYGNSFTTTGEPTFYFLSDRYKGRGRPRKADYDKKTLSDVITGTRWAINKKLMEALK